MQTRPYGQTGKQFSTISFGGMRFPRPRETDEMAEIVLHAYHRGVNYFDTAPGYCQDQSEVIFGRAFRQMKPGGFYVSTKSGKCKGSDLRRQLEQSLERLGVERIHVFHIWCVVTLEEWRQRVEGGAIRAALRAKDEGLIEHLAVSSHLPGDEFTQILGEAPFEGVTLGYCAINFPYRQQAVDEAGRRGLGVATMNPLAGGLIPNNAARFDFLRSQDDPSVVAAALRFNLSSPAVTCALVGFSDTRQVDEAVAAVKDFRPYPADHAKAIRRKILDSFKDLCTGCRYCLPCPNGVPVARMMDAYNVGLLSENAPDAMRYRLKWHWELKPEHSKACSLCGQCEERCPQRLPIRQRLKSIASLDEE